MKNFKSIFNIIIGSIALYLAILFLAVAIDSPLLAFLGFVIAPVAIIYFNKKFTIKTTQYYLSLVVAMLITFLIAGVVSSNRNDVVSDNKNIAIENKDEVNKYKEESTQKEEIKDVDKPNDKPSDEAKENTDTSNGKNTEAIPTNSTENIFDGYRLIEVDGGNLSGSRQSNVVVDIGFGDREYWAFTNEYGQLVKVVAKQIILQDDATEPVKSNGRYYNDEAKVPGTERSDLDEGHVIADSLGGVSNAYNITPQNSTLNRHGDQAYMEKVIRDAGGCTDFTAIITYPDTTTQIPSHYSYTYTINGNVINDEFDNINPDEYNASLESNNSSASNGSNVNTESNENSGNANSTSNVGVVGGDTTPSSEGSSINNSEIVYWTPKGKSYHKDKNCRTLARSKTILSGTIAESGKTDPCDVCYK